MKVKAVVMGKDHMNHSKILKRKESQAKTFRVGEEQYFIDDEHFQITHDKIFLFWKKQYITYYYRQGTAKPLPVPSFPEVVDNGVTTEELAAIFNPWFYRTIAPQKESMRSQILFYGVLACAAMLVYAIYLLSNLPDQIGAEIAARMADAADAGNANGAGSGDDPWQRNGGD